MELLLRYGADPNSLDYKGNTALANALNTVFEDQIRLLLLHGADTDMVSEDLLLKQPLSTLIILLESGLDPRLVSLPLFQVVAHEVTKHVLSDANSVLKDSQNNDAAMPVIAKRNDGFIKTVTEQVCSGEISFVMQLEGEPYLVNSWEAYMRVIDFSMRSTATMPYLSQVSMQKLKIVHDMSSLNMRVSPEIIHMRVKKAITPEIIGLHALLSHGILNRDITLEIASWLVHDAYLQSTIPYYKQPNVIDYIMYLLDRPFIDHKGQQFKRDVLNLVPHENAVYLKQIFPAHAQELIVASRMGTPLVIDSNTCNARLAYQLVPQAPSSYRSLAELETNIQTNGYHTVVRKWLSSISIRLFGRHEIRELENILSNYNIPLSWHRAVFDRKAARQVKLKLHPDKGGSKEDFIRFVKLQTDISHKMQKARSLCFTSLNKAVHSTNVMTHMLNVGTIGIKFFKTPDLDTGVKLLAHTMSIASHASGMPTMAAVSDGLLIAQHGHQHRVEELVLSTLTSVVLLTLVSVNPTIGLTVSASLSLYNLYNVGHEVYDILAPVSEQQFSDTATMITSEILDRIAVTNYQAEELDAVPLLE